MNQKQDEERGKKRCFIDCIRFLTPAGSGGCPAGRGPEGAAGTHPGQAEGDPGLRGREPHGPGEGEQQPEESSGTSHDGGSGSSVTSERHRLTAALCPAGRPVQAAEEAGETEEGGGVFRR